MRKCIIRDVITINVRQLELIVRLTFKTRIGDKVGYQVTLRGKRAEDFLNRVVHIALPRTKDFKGISTGAIDEMGNYTLGIKEHTVFPETADEELKDVFGMAVTVVT
ncbi:MAG: 50S ribosomal protein L5, partial [Candidatus Wolfebacteria bacterium GW2011_GWA1_47_6]